MSYDSKLCYHPYLAMLAFLDDSEEVLLGVRDEAVSNAGGSSLPQVCRDFTESCTEYRERVEGLAKQADPQATEGLATYLYKPGHWLTFGKSDHLSLVLLDDFDPVFSISSEAMSDIQNISVAFCPRLEFTDSVVKERAHQFIAPHKIFAESDRIPPLLTLTRFKLSGLLSLGQGLLMQSETYQALAKRAVELLNELDTPAFDNSEMFKRKDIADVRLCFLDPQGYDEIAVLIFSRNYSLAIAIIAALQSLTLAEIFHSNGEIERRIADHREFDLAERISRVRELNTNISDNHVFVSAYSTLGILHESFQAGAPDCDGTAIITAEFQIHPGHQGFISQQLQEYLLPLIDPERFKCVGSLQDTPLYEVGTNDLSVMLGPHMGMKDLPLLAQPTTDFFKLVRKFYADLPEIKRKGGEETGFRDVNCIPMIPYPKTRFWSDKIDPGHFSMSKVLAEVADRLSTLQFNVEHLDQGLRFAGVPKSLRYSVRYLFQEFLFYIKDPHSFDAVLDLYDAFYTLYEVLSVFAAEGRQPKQEEWACRFDEYSVVELKDALDAFQNALTHRVNPSHRFHNLQDMGIDWRGGLSQLVAAADVAQTCGIGLIRWCANKGRKPIRVQAGLKHIANVTAVKMDPRAVCTRPLFSSISSAPRRHCLTLLHVNVGHIFQPLMYAVYLHEAAHVLYCVWEESAKEEASSVPGRLKQLEEACLSSDSLRNKEYAEVARERVEESFSNALTYWFVFAGEEDLFIKYAFASFSTQSLANTGDDDTIAKKFIEYALRIFLVVETSRGHRRTAKQPKSGPGTCSWFEGMLDQYGGYFRHFRRLWGGGSDKYLQMAKSAWMDAEREVRPMILDLSHDISRMYQEFASDEKTVPWNEAKRKYLEESKISVALLRHRNDIRDQIMKSCKDGNALVLNELYNSKQIEPRENQELPVCLFALMSDLLRAYLTLCLKDFDQQKAMHITRTAAGENVGKVTFEHQNGVEWNKFQFGVGYDGLFCVDPETRRQHLLWQQVLVKKYWDISTQLRGRRLNEIIDKHFWPGPSDKPSETRKNSPK